MAGKKKTGLTTTASFLGNEGAAEAAPSVVREPGSESIHADPTNPPSGALMPEVPPEEQVFVDNGFVKTVALMTFQCFGYGTGMYPLTKGQEVWVHLDHVEGMKSAGVIRTLD